MAQDCEWTTERPFMGKTHVLLDGIRQIIHEEMRHLTEDDMPQSVESFERRHTALMGAIKNAIREELGGCCADDEPTSQKQGSVFCDVLKADGSPCGPNTLHPGPVQLTSEVGHALGLRGLNNPFADGCRISIRDRSKHLSVEVDFVNHVLTSLLCAGALIVSFRHHVKHPTSAVEEAR